MSTAAIKTSKSRPVDTVIERQLIVVRSPIESFFFRTFVFIIPGIYALRALLEHINSGQFPHALLDFVKIPTEIALIIALAFSNLLFSAITHTISLLFSSKAISPQTSNTSVSQASFIKYFDFWLNRHLRKSAGLLSAVAVFVYYVFRIGGFRELVIGASFTLSYVDLLLYIFPSVAYGYFVGIVAWKLFVTSIILQSIPEKFEVNVRFGHPDSAGGLLPIGMLCLQMTYVAVIPTILSALILLAPILAPSGIAPYVTANRVLLFGFSPLILLAGIIGSALGLVPLFKFHQVMLKHKVELAEMLNQVSAKVITLKAEIIEMPQGAKPESIEDVVKEIAALESFYEAHQDINTWPINKRILAGIWGTQAFLLGQMVALWDLVMKFAPRA